MPAFESGILYGIRLGSNTVYGTATVEIISGTRHYVFTAWTWNVYNQTGNVSLSINIEPSCADAI